MSVTIANMTAGPTYALSVAATQHAAVAITAPQRELACFAEFVNTGATVVCVVVAPLPASGTAATPTVVFPVDGTPTVSDSFILPAAMTAPILKTVPTANGGFSVSAIGSGAGPSVIYITPITGN